MSVEIVSRGYNAGSDCLIRVNGVDVGVGRYGRGLNVAVLDQTTGSLLEFKSYDTNDSSAEADSFARAIEDLPIGRFVLVGVRDDAQRSLTDRARRACQLIGSARIYDLQYRYSWALIGQKGAAPGTRSEDLAGAAAARLTQLVSEQPRVDAGLALRALSAGFDVGDSASLSIDGSTIAIVGGYGRGMNVAIVNEVTGQVLTSATYDTYASTQASDAFAALLEQLPAGRIAMIAVKDEATWHLTERAREACELVGSSAIRDLAYRDSWAVVGCKDALPGSACETRSGVSQVVATWWFRPHSASVAHFGITAHSGGYRLGNSSSLSIDGAPIISTDQATRGYNVMVVAPHTGVVVERRSFDVYHDSQQADALAAFIDRVPTGWIVAAAVRDEGSGNLNSAARRALASIGAAAVQNIRLQDSYAVIGRKGAAPGCAPEILSNTSGIAVGYRCPLPSPRVAGFQAVRAMSAGFDVGDAAAIEINGTLVPVSGGYARGLNVVLLTRTGEVQLARSYDTYDSTRASDEFASMIEQAPDGQVVAIAAKDEAPDGSRTRRLPEHREQPNRSTGLPRIMGDYRREGPHGGYCRGDTLE
jgi:hypothetical protein